MEKRRIKKSYPVTANDIAAKLLNNSKADVSKSRQRKVERELKAKKSLTPNWNYSKKKITLKDLKPGLANLKLGKAAGADKMFPEFLINCGLRTKKSLVTLFSRIVHTSKMPPIS